MQWALAPVAEASLAMRWAKSLARAMIPFHALAPSAQACARRRPNEAERIAVCRLGPRQRTEHSTSRPQRTPPERFRPRRPIPSISRAEFLPKGAVQGLSSPDSSRLRHLLHVQRGLRPVVSGPAPLHQVLIEAIEHLNCRHGPAMYGMSVNFPSGLGCWLHADFTQRHHHPRAILPAADRDCIDKKVPVFL